VKNFLLNTTEEPVLKKHISWTVEEYQDLIILFEIEECCYKHPEAPENALIQRIEKNERIRYHKLSAAASPLFVLEHTLNTITGLFGNEKQTTIEMGTKKV
jgi:hypothetical protein